MITPQLVLFPSTSKLYLTKEDRNIQWNSRQLRTLFSEIIEKRIQEKKLKEGQDDRGDILTVLLEDPLFKDSMENIVDECITFFVAGTQTQAVQISNTLCYLSINQTIF